MCHPTIRRTLPYRMPYNKPIKPYSIPRNSVNIVNNFKDHTNLKITDSTNNLTIKNKKKFKALLWNCNGACKKMSALKSLIQKEKPDVIFFYEIKCIEQEANGDIHVLGFDSIFICRTAKGDGVMDIHN